MTKKEIIEVFKLFLKQLKLDEKNNKNEYYMVYGTIWHDIIKFIYKICDFFKSIFKRVKYFPLYTISYGVLCLAVLFAILLQFEVIAEWYKELPKYIVIIVLILNLLSFIIIVFFAPSEDAMHLFKVMNGRAEAKSLLNLEPNQHRLVLAMLLTTKYKGIQFEFMREIINKREISLNIRENILESLKGIRKYFPIIYILVVGRELVLSNEVKKFVNQFGTIPDILYNYGFELFLIVILLAIVLVAVFYEINNFIYFSVYGDLKRALKYYDSNKVNKQELDDEATKKYGEYIQRWSNRETFCR